jgi:hypothetical protein
MKIEGIRPQEVTITFSGAELALVCNALLQAWDLLSDNAFHARTGRTREYAEAIHEKLLEALDKARGGPNEGSPL